MVRHTVHLLQHFKSLFGHFGTFCIKGSIAVLKHFEMFKGKHLDSIAVFFSVNFFEGILSGDDCFRDFTKIISTSKENIVQI